jgi:hypothetical protein
LDLAVKFEEPKFPEPTVGGLTGQQLSLLRQWEEEDRCEAEIFPVSPKGPAERCLEPKAAWSRWCEDHTPEYDKYDSWIDREFE